MIGEPIRHSLDLSLKELVTVYLLLTRHESELDTTQRVLLGRVCDQVYDLLSVEQIEGIDSYYESL